MKTNMGKVDQWIRSIVAVLIALLYFNGILTGTLGVVLLVVAIVFALTSLFSVCPLYTVFGWNTCGIHKKA